MKKNNIAIILARGGSKEIKNKNIYRVNKMPLVYWSIKSCLKASEISSVWVSSDSNKILKLSRKYGANIIKRPKKISGDLSLSEAAWRHALIYIKDKIKNIEVDNEKIEPFLSSINEKLEGLDRDQLIKHFVSAEFNRFISYYKNARDINILSGNKSSRPKRDRKTGGRRGGVRYNFTRFYINIGTKQRLNPLKLISLINESLNSSDHEIGKIEVLKTFSFFEIDSSVSLKLVETLNGTKFNRVNVKIEMSKEETTSSRSKMKKNGRQKERSKKNRWRGLAGSRRKNRTKSNGRNR